MKELQKIIMYETERLVNSFLVFHILTITFFNGAIVLLIFYFLKFDISTISIVFVLIAVLVYAIIKELLKSKSNKANIQIRYNYLLEKYPMIDLYVPIIVKLGARVNIKNACLYFIESKLYMEAFNGTIRKNIPMESKNILVGKDFIIKDYIIDKKQQIVKYQATLMETNYKFSIINNRKLITMIENSKGSVNK